MLRLVVLVPAPKHNKTSASSDSVVQNYQIEHLLRRLKNTSPGCDNLPAWLFKKCSVKLADVVANLINLSFHTGKVYSNWRMALVTPVPKVATPITMSEFRPISVTPILSRIAEKLQVKYWLYPAIIHQPQYKTSLHFGLRAVHVVLWLTSCIMSVAC